MFLTVTAAGQVTIPKHVRDALRVAPGDSIEFSVNPAGEIVVRKAAISNPTSDDRFDAVRGKAQVKWRTDDLMALLRT